ncbi:MAG: MGMT family protein [Spirochaetes bacterium]|nr:MGMT family protein [Spirochaetota bacterium]
MKISFILNSKGILQKLDFGSCFDSEKITYTTKLPDFLQEYIESFLQCKMIDIDLSHFDFSSSTDFEKSVIQSLLKIPVGKTISYKTLAEMSGNKNAFRAVGTALRNNPFPLIFPCHRVIKSTRELGGYSGMLNNPVKKHILKFEGISFDKNGRVMMEDMLENLI